MKKIIFTSTKSAKSKEVYGNVMQKLRDRWHFLFSPHCLKIYMVNKPKFTVVFTPKWLASVYKKLYLKALGLRDIPNSASRSGKSSFRTMSYL